MHMRLLIIILVTTLLFISCSDQDDPIVECDTPGISQEADAEKLQLLLAQIEELSLSESCDDPIDWTFTPYGSKACGGPLGYIAYSTQIDVDEFLELVQSYTEATAAFNQNWQVFSDCAVVNPPSRVVCQEGLPVLEA